LDKIKREQENKEYLRITKDSFGDDDNEENIGDMTKIARKQLTLVFNFFLSIVAGFTAGYYFSKPITVDVGKVKLV